jgi:hypothetical protein
MRCSIKTTARRSPERDAHDGDRLDEGVHRVNANFNASTGTSTAPATGQYLALASVAFVVAAGVVGTGNEIHLIAHGGVLEVSGELREQLQAGGPLGFGNLRAHQPKSDYGHRHGGRRRDNGRPRGDDRCR